MEKWKLRPDVVLRTVEGQTMLIAVLGAVGECEDIWEINETAETYLRALTEPCSEEDLVHLAAGMYDEDPEVLREDIREFIGYLQKGRYLVSEA